MRVEIITTHNEYLKETGFGSLQACTNVFNSIVKLGHIVKVNICHNQRDLAEIVARQPSLVVLAVKYIKVVDEEEIWLADYFAKHGINYTGSPGEILRFDSNKVSAKEHLICKGIATAKYFSAVPGQFSCEEEIPIRFPLFLKPSDAANGNGIDDLSYVTNFREFESKVLSLYTHFLVPILVEEYLDGREYTVAIIQSANGELMVSPIEIIPPESKNGIRILGEKVKKDNSETLSTIKDDEIKNRVKQLAVLSFLNLGIRDYGRIDIKANTKGDYFFIEANMVPGMTAGSSYFPESFELESELNYDQVVKLMVGNGLGRAPVMVDHSVATSPVLSLREA